MFRPLALGLLSLGFVLPLPAATRITHDIGGRPTAVAWEPTAFPLRYEIDARVGALSPDAVAKVQRAFAAWETIEEATIRFRPAGVVQNAASRSVGRIVVSVGDDLMRDMGALAVTSYVYDTRDGRLLDADIRVDPSMFDGGANADMALAHEVGHLLGLDHSAVLSSVMYPWVSASTSTAEFDSDERIAIAAAYPAADPLTRGAILQGKVLGDGGGIVAAQVVAMNEAGQPVGTVLTDPAGEFVLSGIPAGRYRLYAEPLDGPVAVDVLQGSWREAKSAPFPTQFFGPPIDVVNGRIYGNLVLSSAGRVEVNPRVIGVSRAGENELRLSTIPVTVQPGETVRLTIGGDGFVSGMTQMEILNPAFRRVSDFEWWDGSVSARFTVDPAARGGSSVILVRTGNAEAALTGALRVQRAPKMRAVRR